MPNRVLRDCTDSEKVNSLSPLAERFFYRLFMKADDYGKFYADPRLLVANLFPLQFESIELQQVAQWRDECQRAGLIITYRVDGKCFLQIVNFGQRTRTMRSRFPDQPKDDGQLTVNCQPIDSNPPTIVSDLRTIDGLKPKQTETETETNRKGNTPPNLTFEKFVFEIGEQYMETIKMQNRGKDIDRAARDAFTYLMADPVRAQNSRAADYRKLLISWLSHQKPEKNANNNILSEAEHLIRERHRQANIATTPGGGGGADRQTVKQLGTGVANT